MKSITPVISVILLILLTIIASVSAYFFINSSVSNLESSGSADTYPGSDNSRINLVSITGTKALVRNDGTSPVTELVVFINDELFNYTLDKPIMPGELMEINYSARESGQDLEIKVIYNSGKITQAVSPASKNNENSGFTENPLEINEELLDFLRVNSASILEKSYGLEGYCDIASDNSNDLLGYNYTWKVNGANVISLVKYSQKIKKMGTVFSCSILSNGSALCWGVGDIGQLGNGSNLRSAVPVFVNGSHNFASINPGDGHVCGVLTNGSAVCWGDGQYGKLGTGTESNSNVPAFVNASYNFSLLSTSASHTCGILNNGSAVCWGAGYYGTLGNGVFFTEEPFCSLSIVFVNGYYNYSLLTSGTDQTCGILVNGSAVCWGYGYKGQLGNGVNSQSSVPVFVSGGYNFSDISGSIVGNSGDSHFCGILTNGSAVCWGFNDFGQLGTNNTSNNNVPSFVVNNYRFISISAGEHHTCGILVNGSAVCWGYGDIGQLGNGSFVSSLLPVFVSGDYTFSSIMAGGNHNCGVLTNGSKVCWGYTQYGQLGNGSFYNDYPYAINVPVFVSGNYNFMDNNYHWNKDNFISMLPKNYYDADDEVTFECIAVNATSQSIPKFAVI